MPHCFSENKRERAHQASTSRAFSCAHTRTCTFIHVHVSAPSLLPPVSQPESARSAAVTRSHFPSPSPQRVGRTDRFQLTRQDWGWGRGEPAGEVGRGGMEGAGKWRSAPLVQTSPRPRGPTLPSFWVQLMGSAGTLPPREGQLVAPGMVVFYPQRPPELGKPVYLLQPTHIAPTWARARHCRHVYVNLPLAHCFEDFAYDM